MYGVLGSVSSTSIKNVFLSLKKSAFTKLATGTNDTLSDTFPKASVAMSHISDTSVGHMKKNAKSKADDRQFLTR